MSRAPMGIVGELNSTAVCSAGRSVCELSCVPVCLRSPSGRWESSPERPIDGSSIGQLSRLVNRHRDLRCRHVAGVKREVSRDLRDQSAVTCVRWFVEVALAKSATQMVGLGSLHRQRRLDPRGDDELEAGWCTASEGPPFEAINAISASSCHFETSRRSCWCSSSASAVCSATISDIDGTGKP
jgi:hypothetical protein